VRRSREDAPPSRRHAPVAPASASLASTCRHRAAGSTMPLQGVAYENPSRTRGGITRERHTGGTPPSAASSSAGECVTSPCRRQPRPGDFSTASRRRPACPVPRTRPSSTCRTHLHSQPATAPNPRRPRRCRNRSGWRCGGVEVSVWRERASWRSLILDNAHLVRMTPRHRA
jgi:hypothetical protein